MRAYEFIVEFQAPPTLADRIAGVESGGKTTAVNKLSGATGMFQMMPNTFKGLVAKAKPGDPLYKASWEAHKTNPQLQRAAFDALSAENDKALTKAGIPLTDTTRYIAHYLGAPKAQKVLSDPNANLTKYLGPTVFKQNPNLNKKMTGADLIAQFEPKLAKAGGTKPQQVAAAAPAQTAQTAAIPPTQVAAAQVPQQANLIKPVGAANDPAERVRVALQKGQIPDYSKVPV